MKNLYKIIVLGIFIFINISSFAKKKSSTNQNSSPTVSLKLINYSKIPDTMIILLRTSPFQIGGGQEFIAVRDKFDQFRFTFPLLKAPARIFIKTTIKPNFCREFWIEPNDDIVLQATAQERKVAVKVTGNGNGKYKYLAFLDSAYNANTRPQIDRKNNVDFLNEDILYCNNSFRFGAEILNRFKYSMSKSISDILHAELIGQNIKSKWTNVALYRSSAPNDTSIINRILSLENEPLIDTVDHIVAASSPDYINGNKLAAIMYNRTKYHGNPNTILQTYDYLKTKYVGILKDYIITSYLLDRPKGDTSDFKSALLNSITAVKDKSLNVKLQELYSALDYNTATKLHVFEDSEGKKRSLSEWKGKVILIDFWFSGCVPCRHYSKVFEEKILPIFKDNSNVVFIGMNIDKDKKKWLDGIRSKEYTSEATINFSTLGQGFSHPFPKMFNVISAPTLFLIGKDGQLITANLSKDPIQIIQQINYALKK